MAKHAEEVEKRNHNAVRPGAEKPDWRSSG
jgi:hypothetical protein